MPIRIEKISIQKCGPLSNLSLNLSDINLIYGENEKGKSYLVEFIIQALFKYKDRWKNSRVRDTAQGKIVVSGLESSFKEFSPSNSNRAKKLEDFLENQQNGIGPYISNLLIVKEGETEIVSYDENDYGIDKSTFKDILSPRRVLNEIDNNISATIKSAEIDNGEISINKRGEGSLYYELNDKAQNIDFLISQIINKYEQGEIKDLQIKKEQLANEKELLLKAKRYKAYCLHKELENLKAEREKIQDAKFEELKNLVNDYFRCEKDHEKLLAEIESIKSKTQKLLELEKEKDTLLKAKAYEAYSLSKEINKITQELSKIPEEELSKLEQNISLYAEKHLEKEEKEHAFKQLKQESKDYEWLKSAKTLYEKFLTTPLNSENKLLFFIPYAMVLVLIVSIVLFLAGLKTIGVVFSLISAATILFYSTKIKSLLKNYKKDKELKSLQDEFFKRFSYPLENLAQIEEKLSEQEQSFHKISYFKDEINKLTLEMSLLKKLIEESLTRMGVNVISQTQWNEECEKFKKQRMILFSKYQELKTKLEKLEVQEIDYESKDPGVKFDRQKLEHINNDIAALKGLKEQEQEKETILLELKTTLKENKNNIDRLFKEILDYDVEEINWKSKLDELERDKQSLESKIRDIEGQLKGLGLSEEEFEKEDPKKIFSQKELNDIEQELVRIEEDIKLKSEEMSKLRDKIIQVTSIDSTANWNEMIESVYTKKNEITKNLEDIKAKIISGILVQNTIQELQQQEDEKLIAKINSSEIKNLVKKITGRYDTLSFDEEDTIISDEYNSFKLKDLSTGAKEQVMIALRIGFAKSLLKGQSAFLILDDAFQHSDYKKRPTLVNTLFELLKHNWQIIYFTMDEHIRSLFQQTSKALNIELNEISL